MTTYTNLGIKEISTGDEAGTWGTSTNTNFEYFDTAIVGYVDVALFTAGTAGSPNTLNVANFAVSDGRNRIVSFSSAGDLGGTAYVQITPSTFHGYYFIKNDLAANRNLTVFQGTWNGTDPNRAITITNGKEAILRCDGAGVAAVVTRVLSNFQTDSVDATSMTAGSVTVSGAFNGPGTGLTGTASGLSIGGSAGTSTITTDDTTNATMYPTWSTTLSGSTSLKASTDLTYNPFTGELSSTVLNGTFVGTAAAETYSTDDAVVAGTDAQGQAPLTADYSVIITTAANPSGVTLPAATQGRRMIVVNRGTNPINIYPDTGDAIDSSAINIPINLPVNGWMEFNASSTSQWYSTANIVVTASTGVSSFAAGTTGLTPAGATTGAVTLGGTLVSANGGTGFNTYTKGDIIYASATNTLNKLALGSNGNVLTVNTTTGVPEWAAPATPSTTSVTQDNSSNLSGYLLWGNPIAAGTQSVSVKASTTIAYNPAAGTLAAPRFQSTVATGTAPFVVASTTNVANLNASSLNGATFASPGSIGSTTAGSGAFTTLSASSTVSGTGFSNYLASPPAIGGTTASTVRGTTITATTGFTGGTGAFTTLTSTGDSSFGGASLLVVSNTNSSVGLGTATAPGVNTRLKITGKGTTSTTTQINSVDNANVACFQVQDDGVIQTASSTSGKLTAPYNATAGSNTPRVLYVNNGGIFQSQLATTATTGTAAIITTTGLVQQQSSSIRYKQDVQDLVPGLAEVLQLRPITFRSKVEDDDQTRRWGGFIAEEVADIAGLEPFINYNTEGQIESVTYGQITALLVNAIKQQNAVIEDLKARVAALEAR